MSHSSVEMASSVTNDEMEKFSAILGRETTHALDAMESHLLQLSGPKREEFKISFLKLANYQQNSMDFLLMPPPNMQMNTPFVMAGERMLGGMARQSNATPSLLTRSSLMDIDFSDTNWNANANGMNDFNRNSANTSTNERVVFRTNRVSLSNGHAGAVNGLKNATNCLPSDSSASNHQFKVPHVPRGGASNAAKRDLFNGDGVIMANGLSGTGNGLSNATVPASTSNGSNNAPNNHSNWLTNQSNNIFGGRHTTNHLPSTSNGSLSANKDATFNQNGNTDTNTRSSNENGLFGKMNNFTDSKITANDLQSISNNQQFEVPNGAENESKASVFSRLNYNAIKNIQQYDVNEDSMDADDNGDDDLEDADDDDIYVSDEDDENDEKNNDESNHGQNKFTGNIITKAMRKQEANGENNSFGTAQATMNNRLGTQNAGNSNQQPNGPIHSAEFQRKLNKKSKREWMCYYCNDKNAKFATIDEVYEHWKLNHHSGAADASTPFRFYPVYLLNCHMDSCGYYSTFRGLRQHHQNKHKNDSFVVIMNGRCALCLKSGDGLREHACPSLQNGVQLEFYNPVLLTDQDLAELQAIECREMKQDQSKIECGNCGHIFGTRVEMTQHHHQAHSEVTINYRYIDADVKPVVAFICHCCQREIQPSKHVDHIKFKAIHRWKSSMRNNEPQPTWEGWYRNQELNFLKTKVVFSNGMVLFKQNLSGTNLGNHEGFTRIAKEIYDSLKAKQNQHSLN